MKRINHSLVIQIVLIISVCSVSGYAVNDDSIWEGWKGKKADIYFAVDSSSSIIWYEDYNRILAFVADLVQGMDIGPDKTRVGVGSFSIEHKVFLPIDNGRTKRDLIEAIMETPRIGGDGYMSRAIQGVREKALSPKVTRKDVPLIAVLLTDGEFRKKQLTRDNATLARNEGIFLYTVGIGRDVKKAELRSIVNDPKESFAFTVRNFVTFHTIKEQLMNSMKKVEKMQGDQSILCGKNKKADVLFVFDEFALGSIQSKTVQQFIKNMASKFSMNSGNVRIGVISKNSHDEDITLGQYNNREDFLKHIDDDSGPNIIPLFRRAWVEGGFSSDSGGRSEALKRIVLILHSDFDNKWDCFQLVDNVRRAQHDDIGVYILNIRSGLKDSDINQIERSGSYVLDVDSMDSLLGRGDKFQEDFCLELK